MLHTLCKSTFNVYIKRNSNVLYDLLQHIGKYIFKKQKSLLKLNFIFILLTSYYFEYRTSETDIIYIEYFVINIFGLYYLKLFWNNLFQIIIFSSLLIFCVDKKVIDHFYIINEIRRTFNELCRHRIYELPPFDIFQINKKSINVYVKEMTLREHRAGSWKLHDKLVKP